MKVFSSARALLVLLLLALMIVGLNGCGSTGGEADTDAPLLTLAPLTTSNLERTRVLTGTVEAGASVAVTADTAASVGPVSVTAETWSCSVDLVPGANTISVKATDATGNNLTLAFVLTYEVVTLDLALLTTSEPTQTLGGTLVSGGSLIATLDGTALAGAPIITGNSWAWDITLEEGSHTLVLDGTDGLGQKTTLTQTLVRDSTLPSLTINPVETLVDVNSISIGGTIAEDAAISMTVPAEVAISDLPVIRPAGIWARTLTGLVLGRNQIDIIATRASDGKQGTARLVVFYQP